jgi:aryl-alcohol dehydrogenase-like predicted oxidoreductase
VLAACEELGHWLRPMGPLGIGYLPGPMDAHTTFDSKTDLRSGFDRFSPESLAANCPFVDVLKRFAETKNATPAQMALAWLLAQRPWIVPIPGTRNLDHLHENLRTIDIYLSSADLREIETAVSGLTVHGGRMNREQTQAVDQAA